MSITNFIPTVWSANILMRLQKSYIFVNLANRDYEGEIKQFGDTVKINQIGKVTTKKYTRNADIDAPQELTDAQREIKVDQADYFNFQIDDLDKAQTNPKVMTAASGEAGSSLSDVTDQYLAGLITEAGLKSASVLEINSLNVEDIILEIGETMTANNIPKPGRFMVLPPWLSTKLVRARLNQLTVDSTVYQSGYIGTALGFAFYESNNVNNDGTNYNVPAGIFKQSLSFAEQIVELKAYNPEKRFADALKGLHVYGGKLLRPDMTYNLQCKKKAEA